MTQHTPYRTQDKSQGGCAFVIALFFTLLALFSLLIWAAWNLGVAPVFNTEPISFFWEAVGLGLGLMILRGLLKSVGR